MRKGWYCQGVDSTAHGAVSLNSSAKQWSANFAVWLVANAALKRTSVPHHWGQEGAFCSFCAWHSTLASSRVTGRSYGVQRLSSGHLDISFIRNPFFEIPVRNSVNAEKGKDLLRARGIRACIPWFFNFPKS